MKAKSLNEFLNEVRNRGVLKQNQYQIVVNTGIPDVDNALESITLWCDTFQLPSRTQEFTDLPFSGYPFKLPTKLTMSQEHEASIRMDGEGVIRRALLKWQSYTSNPNFSDGSSGEGDKSIPSNSSIRVLVYDDSMNVPIETYKILGVVPSVIGELEFSQTDAEVVTCSVTFQSQWWELEDINSDTINDIR